MDLSFYDGKRVFVTGHTGFKGSWLCRMLVNAGAKVTGYALEPPDGPNLYSIAGLEGRMTSVIGDVRDLDALREAFDAAHPDIVFHLAAQPLVREGYRDPVGTFETNVMGTVNLLECVRLAFARGIWPRSVLNVTTDKVYANHEWFWGYRESDALDGYDPYANSKSCSELVTNSYRLSFLDAWEAPAVSTARAGNVIGGGDYAKDRIIPDCVRAAVSHRPVVVRNPRSIRPYQHVLEPLTAYLMIARRQYQEKQYAGPYNVGPDECDCVSNSELVDIFRRTWGGVWREDRPDPAAPHETYTLRLDNSKIRVALGWRPRWGIEKAVEMVCRFAKTEQAGGDILAEMDAEIAEYLAATEED